MRGFASLGLTFVLSAQLLSTAASAAVVGGPGSGPAIVPTGQIITATAAPGSVFLDMKTGLRPDADADASGAVNTALSPDGKTLLVLTSGYNKNNRTITGAPIQFPVLDPRTGVPTSTMTPLHEWIFVYDVSAEVPRKLQQITVPNTYSGLAWDPRGHRFYVSGGIDDKVYAFAAKSGTYAPDAPFILLGHNSGETNPFPQYDGGLLKNTPAGIASKGLLPTGATVAGIAVSPDGKTLVAANLENDSISFVNTASRAVLGDKHFYLPGQLEPRGEYPYDVAILPDDRGAAEKVYVTSLRDDEVMIVHRNGSVRELRVGSGPNRMLLSKNHRRLYVANGNSDTVAVVDTENDRVLGEIRLYRAGYPYRGGNPNALALSPDNKTLYVTLGGENAVAVVDAQNGRVLGRIPTGWYPNSVTVSENGRFLYVVNAKSNVGANPANSRTTPAGDASNTTYRNQYNWNQQKAGLLVIPVPHDGNELATLSNRVDENNGFHHPQNSPIMAFLHSKIKHVIYIVNENRTYDQVLGDVPGTNGMAALMLFGANVAPNHHLLATDFVTFDNYYDPGESSGVGWNWSMAGHTTDFVEKHQSVLYGNAGFNGMTYDYQGENRNINVAMPIHAAGGFFGERLTTVLDPSGSSTILPGTKDVAAAENAGDEAPSAIGGYIWDSALRRGLTIRNYGWQVDQTAYESGTPFDPPLVRHPFENHAPQSPPSDVALMKTSDVYYRGFDQRYPDVFRIEEWMREFNGYVEHDNLPNLEMMTIPHDHFGSFGTAIEGLNTPTLEFADNDYAIGQLVEAVSHSKYWKDTAIFVIEDDSQNGPDHVDGHRSIAYVISAYTKRHAIDHSLYTTDSVLRTIEDLLGIRPVSMPDANALPMADAFTTHMDDAPYTASVPGVLCAPPVAPDLVGAACTSAKNVTRKVSELHDGAWWAEHTKGFDFSVADRVDSAAFNRLLWVGIKGDDAPVPSSIGATKDVDDK